MPVEIQELLDQRGAGSLIVAVSAAFDQRYVLALQVVAQLLMIWENLDGVRQYLRKFHLTDRPALESHVLGLESLECTSAYVEAKLLLFRI